MLIEISDADFERLKKYAEPLVDTPASIISRIIDAYERQSTQHARVHQEVRQFDAGSLPDLTHTRLLNASFGEATIQKPTWDSLLKVVLIHIFKKYGSISAVHEISGANVVAGIKNDSGYKPLGEFPFSYQGQSAVDIARCAIKTAKSLNCSLTLSFEWRDKEGSAFPGERGAINFQPMDRK